MRTWIGLFLITSIVLILALRGALGAYPDEWEWVGVVLAAVGVAMATPGALQMVLGRAELVLEPDTYTQGTDRCLLVFLKNPPVSRVLKNLGVKRDTIQSLTVQLQIAESGSGTILVPIRQSRIYLDSDDNDSGSDRVILPPTYSVAASIAVARWDPENDRVVASPDRLRPNEQPLPQGLLQARIVAIVDGEPSRFTGEFVVGNKADDLTWAPKSLKRVT